MTLDTFTSIFKQIDRIPSVIKTVIIVLLFSWVTIDYIKTQNEDIIRSYMHLTEMTNQKAEEYTLETASDINNYVADIAKRDTAAYNVLLLSYHNTQKSLQGYSYLYLNCLTEKPKGIEVEPAKEFWTNLEYIYYEDELRRIHDSEYLRIQDIESIKMNMPKIYRRLKLSGANSAAFYTIEGVRSPIGLIVVLYDHPVNYQLGHYMETISTDIQKLAILLDYKAANKQ